MEIIKLQKNDIRNALDLVWRVFQEFEATDYSKQGIEEFKAKSLFQTVEERCKSEDNISKITVNSSPYAIEVYHCLGFFDTDKELTVNGIRFTPMFFLLK